MKTVLVYGPQGCGKTHHRATLARKLGTRVVTPEPHLDTIRPGCLHLDCQAPTDDQRKRFDIVLHAAVAFRLCGIVAQPEHGPFKGKTFPAPRSPETET